jgi:hypothetical protein
MDNLKLGGRLTWEGKLDVVIANRNLGRRELQAVKLASESSETNFVVMQVDAKDVVENYFLGGRWIKPKQETKLIDAIRAVAGYFKVDINLSQLVLDCIKLGVFDK